MASWDGKPAATAATIAEGDKFPLSDQSQPEGSRDATIILSELRKALGGTQQLGVSQTAHGFAVGAVVRYNGTAWVASTADTASNAVVGGLVTSVPGANSFTITATGFVSGLSGLTAGSVYYLQDAGGLGAAAGTVIVPVLLATSATTGVLLGAAAKQPGGGNAYYDLQLGFPGAPDAAAADVILLPRAVTIDDGEPGEVYVATNPTSTATLSIEKNGAPVGSIEISTAGLATWTLAADIELVAGDVLTLVAPSPADATLADVIVAFKGLAA